MNILLKDCTETYENLIPVGDLNMPAENPQLNNFMQLNHMSHINEPTSFQPHDPMTNLQ